MTNSYTNNVINVGTLLEYLPDNNNSSRSYIVVLYCTESKQLMSINYAAEPSGTTEGQKGKPVAESSSGIYTYSI
jgi:hypothetical protein